ncbi:MAG: TIGR03790 family protein [Planctomycetota bacterium]
MVRTRAAILMILVCSSTGFALKPDEILVIANSEVAASVRIAQYYCKKRGIPGDNIIAWPLGARMARVISRNDYERKLAEPVRSRLTAPKLAGKIRCLLTTYGVPIKVGGRGPLEGQEAKLRHLEELLEQLKSTIEKIEQSGSVDMPGQKEQLKRRIAQVQSEIDRIKSKETDASVDSELSMVLFGDYQLYRWQPNLLKGGVLGLGSKTVMVSRLDGPGQDVAIGLVDKAIAAEKTGLKGIAYIDSRGLADDRKPYSPGYFDRSLKDLAELIELRAVIPVKEERTGKLFAVGDCPRTAIYCGWYSLKKYVDAFDFVDGAIGYHIASWEAADLRNPNSSQWCPAMLKDGITATLGAVAEPYLHSFPEPKEFFRQLFDGHCLVEAYYRTKPFNSWQLVSIGDPLYRPFKKSGTAGPKLSTRPAK